MKFLQFVAVRAVIARLGAASAGTPAFDGHELRTPNLAGHECL
jgi:hypothetical protein